jgi:FkbM family methyltransferase
MAVSFRAAARDLLARNDALNVAFRRHIWSRLHYPEVEIRRIDRLRGRPFDLTVDVGAALGSYTWVLGRKSRDVVAFEPGERHFRSLRSGAFASNVTVVNSAVGRFSGAARLFTLGEGRDADHTATLSLSNPLVANGSAQAVDVSLVSLDEYFLTSTYLGRAIDLIKVDVEGFELEVLAGGREILSTHKPLVICEIEARHNVGYAEVFCLMESLGYRSSVYSGGRYVDIAAEDVPALQSQDALAERLSGRVKAEANRYLNNFVFYTAHTKVNLE